MNDKLFTKTNDITGATPQSCAPAWPYTIRPLTPDDIPAMQILQARAGNGQVVARTNDKLAAHFKAGHDGIGIFQEEQLVAQSLISTSLAAGAPKSVLAASFKTQSLMGGVVVAPEARGRGLMAVMVQIWLDEAAKKNIHYAHARVRTDNDKSLRIFLRHGLTITATGPSPDRPDHDVFFLHKSLQAPFALHDDFNKTRPADLTPWLRHSDNMATRSGLTSPLSRMRPAP